MSCTYAEQAEGSQRSAADRAVPRFLTLPAPLDDPLLDLQELLASVHRRLRRIEASFGCIAVLVPCRGGAGLKLYLGHDPAAPETGTLAGAPFAPPVLPSPQNRLQARLVDDLLFDHDPGCAHDRWLLLRGWRSTLTLPLLRRDTLLGFLLVTAGRSAAFTAEALEPLQPLLDLLLLRIGDHLGSLADLHTTLALVAEMVALRDPQTGGHLERVSRYSQVIARELEGQLTLPEGFAEAIGRFAPLHDVGKVGIPDRILLKPGMLEPEEQALMRTHVAIGMALIERLLEALQLNRDPSLNLLRDVVAHHHEYLDGSGYPLGLRGSRVSLAGRIVAVADIYDSLTQERPYKLAIPDARAGEILWGMVRGGKLDRRCVEALLGHEEQRGLIRAELLPQRPADPILLR